MDKTLEALRASAEAFNIMDNKDKRSDEAFNLIVQTANRLGYITEYDDKLLILGAFEDNRTSSEMKRDILAGKH